MHLPEGAPHRDHVRSMVASDQIVLSPSGLVLARVVPHPDGGLAVSIGKQFVPGRFAPASESPSGIMPRILNVTEQGALVFGTLLGGETGVYRLSPTRAILSTPAEELLGVHRIPGACATFVRNTKDDPDQIRVVTSFLDSHLTIHRGAMFSLTDTELIVLEPIDFGPNGTVLYRFAVGPKGFKNVYPVPLAKNEHVVGLVRWLDGYALGVRTASGSSVFKLLGKTSQRLGRREISAMGKLEILSQSPTGKAFAWVARVNGKRPLMRKFVVGKKIVRVGHFTCDPFDVVWSPNGRHAALRIREEGNSEHERLVSARSVINIPSGCHVEEFCVNDQGKIVAWIYTDGRFCHPMIEGECFSGVEHAWNLSISPEGSIGFNCVLSNVILHVRVDANVAG